MKMGQQYSCKPLVSVFCYVFVSDMTTLVENRWTKMAILSLLSLRGGGAISRGGFFEWGANSRKYGKCIIIKNTNFLQHGLNIILKLHSVTEYFKAKTSTLNIYHRKVNISG